MLSSVSWPGLLIKAGVFLASVRRADIDVGNADIIQCIYYIYTLIHTDAPGFRQTGRSAARYLRSPQFYPYGILLSKPEGRKPSICCIHIYHKGRSPPCQLKIPPVIKI